MPSGVVHSYFAERVTEGLKPEILKIIEADKEAYLVGSQGPDLLFYLRYEKKPLDQLAVMQHQTFNAYEIFTKSGGYVKENYDDTLLAFLFGQLCHYALDSNVHPYVYHRELDLPNYYTKGAHKYIHVVLESGMDYLCVRDHIKKNTRTYKGYKNLNISKKSRNKIAHYYSDVVAPVFEMNLPVETAEKMIKLMRRFLRLCDDMTGIRYLLIRGVEKLLGQPRNVSAFVRARKENKEENWLNNDRVPFPKYRYEEIMSTDTVEEMAKTAHGEAIILINSLYDFVFNDKELDPRLFNRNYLGARKIKD